MKILFRILFLWIAFTLGACMTEDELKQLHRTLRQPKVFQQKYGDSVQAIVGVGLPDSLWEGVILKGWTFKNVTFNGTKWNKVKVVDGVFDNCTFKETEFVENTFINTKFYNPEFRNGIWSNNQFQGGLLDGMQILLFENWSITFEKNHFEGLEISNNQPKNQWDKRNGVWASCSFKNCKIKDNDFDGQILDNVVFEGCTFENNNFGLETFRGENIRVSHCSIKGCKTLTVTTNVGGIIEYTDFNQEIGAGSYGKMNHVKIDGMGKGPAWAFGGGSDIQIKNITSVILDSVDGAIIKDVIKPTSYAGFYHSKNIQVTDVKVKTLTIDTVVDATFENIVADELDGISCTRCTFKNMLVKKIILGPDDKIELIDCKFENVRRTPGVTVTQLQKGADTPDKELEMVLPWELPGAQDPKTIQPVK